MITSDDLAEKFYANLESVAARGAKLILFADEKLASASQARSNGYKPTAYRAKLICTYSLHTSDAIISLLHSNR